MQNVQGLLVHQFFCPTFPCLAKMSNMAKTSHFFLYHCHLHNVSKLTCYAARRNIARNVCVFCFVFLHSSAQCDLCFGIIQSLLSLRFSLTCVQSYFRSLHLEATTVDIYFLAFCIQSQLKRRYQIQCVPLVSGITIKYTDKLKDWKAN